MSQVLIPVEQSTLELLIRMKPTPDASLDETIAAMSSSVKLERKAPPAPQPPSRPAPCSWRGSSGLLLGERITGRTKKDLYLNVLHRLHDLEPTVLEKLSKCRGHSRLYAASSPEQLYPGRPKLALKHSERIGDWWVGTNYGERDIERILKAACRACGLLFGNDLKLIWR